MKNTNFGIYIGVYLLYTVSKKIYKEELYGTHRPARTSFGGVIVARWRFEDRLFHYIVTIPDGVNATFQGQTLAVGTNKFLIQKEKTV